MLRRTLSVRPLTSRLPGIARRALSQKVCSWNEWDPLEEVIVGLAEGSAVPPNHPAEEAKIFNLPNTLEGVGPRDPDKIRAAAEELDGFADILRSHGVTVRRPRAEPNVPFQTPYFSSETMNGWTCPRDVLTVVGPEVIEAASPWRSRAFEVMAYRDILMEYYRADPTMIWSAAPPPAGRRALPRRVRGHRRAAR